MVTSRSNYCACVAKLVNATALEAVILADLRVRVPPQAIDILLFSSLHVHQLLTFAGQLYQLQPTFILKFQIWSGIFNSAES
jgi:hypothetical protein